MFGALLGDDRVARRRELQGLRHFLQGALMIGDRAFTPSSDDASGGPITCVLNKSARGVEPGVQKQARRSAPPRRPIGGLFSRARRSFLRRGPATDDRPDCSFCATSYKWAALTRWALSFERRPSETTQAPDQGVADREAQDGVAQKFELLIIGADIPGVGLLIAPANCASARVPAAPGREMHDPALFRERFAFTCSRS